MTKVTFDGVSKTITVSAGVTSIEVGSDLYSDWKDWAALNPQFLAAFRTFGGDPTASGQFAPRYFFLLNGWRVVVNNLTLAVDGNLYTQEGDTPFVQVNSQITHKTSDASVVSSGSGLSLEQDSKLSLTLDILEADEEYTATKAYKRRKGSTEILIEKDVSGGRVSNPPITLTETP